MGKRGPKPKPASERRESPTGVRLPKELRKGLETAAQKNSRSLSREIEHRLKASFGQDPQFEKLFGGIKTFWLFQQMAQTILQIENQTKKRWWTDRFTFNQMKSAIDIGLDIVGPKGPSIPPKHMLKEAKQLLPALRVTPAKIGREAMLINLWSLSELANQAAGEIQPGYLVLGEPEDKRAATFLGNELNSDPMEALAKLKRPNPRRRRGQVK